MRFGNSAQPQGPQYQPEDSEKILVTSNRLPQNGQTGFSASQVYPLEGTQYGYASDQHPSRQQAGNRIIGMVTPIMPISEKANTLFPWSENILYLEKEEQLDQVEPGQFIPDVLEAVKIPPLEEIPINFQEYKESLAIKQGIPLPKNSLTQLIKEQQILGVVRRQGWILQKQMNRCDLLQPAQNHPDPIHFWCPVCDNINQTEVVQNGCCPGKLRVTKNIRSETIKCFQCEIFTFFKLIFPLCWIKIFFVEYLGDRNIQVHLCKKCKRVVGTNGTLQGFTDFEPAHHKHSSHRRNHHHG